MVKKYKKELEKKPCWRTRKKNSSKRIKNFIEEIKEKIGEKNQKSIMIAMILIITE